jgi:hypothetical protein
MKARRTRSRPKTRQRTNLPQMNFLKQSTKNGLYNLGRANSLPMLPHNKLYLTTSRKVAPQKKNTLSTTTVQRLIWSQISNQNFKIWRTAHIWTHRIHRTITENHSVYMNKINERSNMNSRHTLTLHRRKQSGNDLQTIFSYTYPQLPKISY